MTMQLIQTQTLGTAAASIEFTSIPQDFTDLVFLASVRSSTAGTSVEPCLVTFNADTSNYTHRTLNGTGSATASASGTSRLVFNSPRTGTTASTFGNGEFYFPNYTSTDKKVVGDFGVSENNATASYITAIAHLVDLTTAITSLLIFSNVAGRNFTSGSSFFLYGIKNS